MTQTPTLAQLIKHAIDARLLEIHTALVAKVESYDAEKQLVNVSPVQKRHVKNLEGEWMSEQLPILCDIPVLFPRAGGFFLSFPIKPGDYVQLLFNEVDMEECFEDTTPTATSNQRFTLEGSVALPGVYPQAQRLLDAHTKNLVIGKDQGLQIHIDDQNIRLGSEKAGEALAIASAVKTELEKIKSAFQSHVHTYHNTPTTTQIAPIGNIAAKNVVAE